MIETGVDKWGRLDGIPEYTDDWSIILICLLCWGVYFVIYWIWDYCKDRERKNRK